MGLRKQATPYSTGRRARRHFREVNAHFAHGKVKNWFGGSSNATTQLLDAMPTAVLLRRAARGRIQLGGVARMATPAQADPQAAFNSLVDAVVW